MTPQEATDALATIDALPPEPAIPTTLDEALAILAAHPHQTYTVHRREIELLVTHALAAALTTETGEAWTALADSQYGPARLHSASGDRLTVTLTYENRRPHTGGEKDRWGRIKDIVTWYASVSGMTTEGATGQPLWWPDCDTDGVKTPRSLRGAVTRPMRSLARDILKRFLPVYRPRLAEWKVAYARQQARDAAQHEITDRLQSALPAPWRLDRYGRPHERPSYQHSVDGRNPEERHGVSEELRADVCIPTRYDIPEAMRDAAPLECRVDLTLRGLTTEHAEAIWNAALDILNPRRGGPPLVFRPLRLPEPTGE